MRNLYIGFDRVGTNQRPDLPPPAELRRSLRELQDEGAWLFIASRKSYLVLQRVCAELSVTPWMYCCENGGHVVFPHSGFERVAARDPDLTCFARAVDTLRLPPSQQQPTRAIWSRRFGNDALTAKAIIDSYVQRHRLALDVYAYPERDGGVDVVPRALDKANVLEYFPPAAIIHYLCDSENDLGIMRDARVTPHTVSNAKPEVKGCVARKRGYVSSRPGGEGITDILDRLGERFLVAHA
jgi:hypothetical protein